ncbi:MAG: polymerase domain protein [Pseudomonadota bacterium]|jgi:aminoglycoside phosphotransferase family enzyme
MMDGPAQTARAAGQGRRIYAAPATKPASPTDENGAVADLLERISRLLTEQHALPFRARAYHDAAGTLRELATPVRRLLERDGDAGLEALPAVGPSIAAVIHEYLGTGHVRLLARLEGHIAPEDVFLTLPGIGERLALRLHEELGVETLEELELAAHDGRLERMPGFGERRTGALRAVLRERLSRATRLRVPDASVASPAAEAALPDVATLLAVDALYRERAAGGLLRKLAPRRLNPGLEAWLPILHTEQAGWHFTALFSNSGLAHRMGATHDWVVLYYELGGRDGQSTVVTEWHGSLAGRRVVRGQEAECKEHYAGLEPESPAQRSAATVRALRSRRAYPDPETHVELSKTPRGWSFSTPAYTYELLEPRQTPQLDLTTPGARRAACEAELQRNQPLAASVYRAVVPVSAEAGELRVGGSGEAIDWLLKARTLPRHLMLDAYILRGEVGTGPIDALGSVLSRFYAAAPLAALGAAQYLDQLAAEIAAARTTLLLPRHELVRGVTEAVCAALSRWLEQEAELLRARAALVRQGHGALRPENICLDGEPVVIGCLDEREQSLLDPCAELASLELECRRLGNDWIGARLARCYAQQTGDVTPHELRAFYQARHALLQAASTAEQLDEPGADLEAGRARAATYLQLAAHALAALMATGGASGSASATHSLGCEDDGRVDVGVEAHGLDERPVAGCLGAQRVHGAVGG